MMDSPVKEAAPTAPMPEPLEMFILKQEGVILLR